MAINKVIYGNDTLIDLTDSTVDPDSLLSGKKAYGANGEPIRGTLVVPKVLNDLSDVVITNPTIDQGLTFDGTNWVNYGAKIILTYDDEFKGQTITCTQGQMVITKTAPSSGNSVTLYVPITGNWTISAEYEGDTFYSDPNPVNIIALGTAVMAHISAITIPEGATVLPTDDIQTWLACANITNKSYTTLAEVLADRETFETLLRDSNACDYMARSTTWADDVADDADAMALIGKYDYCSNALLSNATWAEAIANSDYSDSVISSLVPAMTSYNTPSGEVIYSSEFSQQPAYQAFDKNNSTTWSSSANTYPQHIGYKFDNPVFASRLDFTRRNLSAYSGATAQIKIQGSVDGSTDWIDLTEELTQMECYTSNVVDTILFTKNFGFYRAYRVYYISGSNSQLNATTAELQFYGRASSNVSNTNGIIHTANGDTVTCNGNTYVADTNGIIEIDFSDFDEGTYTFTSSIAKNPSDLSQDYTKQFRITKSPYGGTTELYLMPDAVKTLYWWGYIDNNFATLSTGNGWSISVGSSYSFVDPTFNLNNIQVTGSGGKVQGVGNKTALPITKIHSIAKQTSNDSSYGLYVLVAGNTVVTGGNTLNFNTPNTLQYKSTNVTGSYVSAYRIDSRSGYYYALWYE